jgi:capsular exopolysaccharide synthesis family protein
VSTFFKALQQAEKERALAEWRPEALPAPVPDSGAQRPENADGLETVWRAQDDGLNEHLVSLLFPAASEAEPYRELRHLVEERHRIAGLSIVAVSSPAVGDGKTTTAINLAGALAQSREARVLLIDADLRQPSIASFLALENRERQDLVSAILDPNLTLAQVTQRCEPSNLAVVSAGSRASMTYELLRSPRLGELLEEGRAYYDYVILDTPPLLHFPDCRVIGRWVDGFIVVVGAHKTPRQLVGEALSSMDEAKVMGFVFNRADRFGADYYDTRREVPGFSGRVARMFRGSIGGRPGSSG